MTVQIQQNIQLESSRCYECGNYYATEISRGREGVRCPFCTVTDLNESQQKRRVLERSNNALRGVIKRMKNKSL